MDEQQDINNSEHSRVQVYQVPGKSEPGGNVPARKRRRWPVWLFVFPLAAWLACMGLMVYALIPMIYQARAVSIPVTGGDPSRTPVTKAVPASPTAKAAQVGSTATPQRQPPSEQQYVDAAKQSLDTCTGSFQQYFLLQQMAIDNPDVFSDDTWRSEATAAMNSFHDDCQALGKLPDAPPAYADVDHWLKLAAGEVDPATTSFSAALQNNAADQFQLSIRHMLKFVDDIHNAVGAFDGVLQRKQV